MKTQVRIRECILGNELIKYLRKCDNFLISRHASLYWVLKIIHGKAGHQKHSEQTFLLFSQLMKLYVLHNYAACVILIKF